MLRTPRFEGEPDPLFRKINDSIGFDIELLEEDIEQNKAHAKALLRANIITDVEYRKIVEGLDQVLEKWQIQDADEDVHMMVERSLTELIGETGAKLHTARSRNDQVATDLRLYLKKKIELIFDRIETLQRTIIDVSEKNIDLIMPGYTHLQRAQPVLLAHHLMAYFFMLERDTDRFFDCLLRVEVLPAGSGALAGVSYDLDREILKEELDFGWISENSIDAVSDRDFAAEFLSCAAILGIHLSRLAEELVLWNSSEFGFINIADSFASGSSIMPQKKNPDVAELIRAKCGKVIGELMTMLTVLKGLPLSYNKDLQEDKEPLFNTCKTLELVLPAMNGLLKSITFDGEKMRSSAESDFTSATDVADYLVSKGAAFRKAHGAVASLVKKCIESGKTFKELSLKELKGIDPAFDDGFFEVIKLENVVNSKISKGGTAKFRVLEQIEAAKKLLADDS